MPVINFAGLASGIDSEALIDAVSAATRQQRVKPNEDKVSELEDENSALKELKGKLTKLKDLAFGFSSANSGGIAKQADSTNENIISASASNGASLGIYEFTVVALAKNATASFDNTFATGTSVISPGNNGTVTITLGGTPLAPIAVNGTTTWDQLATSINAASTELTASIIQVGTGQYKLAVASKNSGVDAGSLTIGTGGAITGDIGEDPPGPGITLDQAQDAEITMSGISGSIFRSSNTITDLIPGVTLSLENESLTPVRIAIKNDTAGTKSKVKEFIELFNEIITYSQQQSSITQEGSGDALENIFSPLATSRLDDNVIRAIKDTMSASTYASGGTVRIFADLGITTNRDGTLAFAEDKFDTAIETEANSVRGILQNFGDAAGVTNGTIDQYIRFNGLFDVSTQNNEKRVKELKDRIAQAVESIEKQKAMLRQRFARLEAVVGKMQGDQQALTSALSSLNTKS